MAVARRKVERPHITYLSAQELSKALDSIKEQNKDLPDNGNAKNFKSFIKTEESKTLYQHVCDNPMVMAFHVNMTKDILKFDYDDFHLYFRYLEFMMKRKDPMYSKNIKWFAEHLNYEELLRIQETYPLIKVDLFNIIFTNENNEEIIFKFFE